MKIFINYRRGDEANITYAIANALMREFGDGNIFFDRQAIKPGSEFPQEIDKALDNCRIFIVIIGREWLNIMHQRQAFDEKDYVLNEIEHALEKEIFILPILVDDTPMPSTKDLPPELSRLSLINAVNISSDPKHLPTDIKLLIVELNDIFSRIPRRSKSQEKDDSLKRYFKKVGWILGLLISIVVIVIFVIIYFQGNNIEQKPAIQEKEQHDLPQSKKEINKIRENQVIDTDKGDNIKQKLAEPEKEKRDLPQSKLKINNLQENQVADIDGNIYNTIIIGDQVWMAENLIVTHYQNGDLIQRVTDEYELNFNWSKLISGAYCIYDNNTSNSEMYGYLYNWFVINDSRSVCPVGWHVPDYNEWNQLAQHIGDIKGPYTKSGMKWENVGRHLKSVKGWSNNGNGIDDFGFSGFAGGICTHGSFYDIGYFGLYWSSSENPPNSIGFLLTYNSTNLYMENRSKSDGLSIRCIKD